MLSIKPLGSASDAKDYYSQGDYYGSEGTGIWLGGGAKELGLSGNFDAKNDPQFDGLLKGVLPNGQTLGRKTNENREHRPGIDLTLSCPKSFSVYMLLFADKNEQKALGTALMSAVQKTLEYIEQNGFIEVRKGKGGTIRNSVDKLTFASFIHTTNRNLEPQLHVHNLLANVASNGDGTYRSIAWDKLFKTIDNPIKSIGQIFRNELAIETKKIGLDIEPKILSDGTSSFELKKIDSKLVTAFSTRRAEIEALCEKYGIETKQGRDAVVLNSRKAKVTVTSDQIYETWKEIANKTLSEIKTEDKVNLSNDMKVVDRDAFINKIVIEDLQPHHDTRTNEFEQKLDQEKSIPNTSSTDISIVNTDIQTYSKRTFDKISTQDVYRSLYDRLPSLLPEFGFKSEKGHYVSTTGYKVDGSEGKRGKVYVYSNNPGTIVDYTKGSKSIWEYVSDNIVRSNDKQDIFKYLMDAAGLTSNTVEERVMKHAVQSISVTGIESIKPDKPQEHAIDSKVWQHVQDFATQKIQILNNQVIAYLSKERSYSVEVIKDMDIGYIPSKKELTSYLRDKGIEDSVMKESVKALGYIGNTHKMTIPYRDVKGNIVGFVGRDIKYNDQSNLGKYLYNKGFIRNNTLFNAHLIDSNKPIVIVEGILDASHAKSVGINNVVALGGISLSNTQIEILKALKVKEVILCLDNDKSGDIATNKISDALKDQAPDIVLKQASLPQSIKDIDQLLTEQGKESCLSVINTAKNISIKVDTESSKAQQIQSSQVNKTEIVKDEQTLFITLNNKEDNRPQIKDPLVNTAQLLSDLNNNESKSPTNKLDNLLKNCIADITYLKSVFNRQEIIDELIKHSIGEYTTNQINREIDKLNKSNFLVGNKDQFTTKELEIKERQILKYVTDGIGQAKQIIKDKHFDKRCMAFERRERAKNPSFIMNDQQRVALKFILCSKDNVIAVEGLPGVGKSTVLNAVRDISDKKIINLIGLGEDFKAAAPTASAAKTLKDTTSVESFTVHKFVQRYTGYIEGRGKSSLRFMKYKFAKTVVFLDENSLISTTMMHKLLKLRDMFGFKLVSTGGVEQNSSIEAGNPSKQILNVISSIKLDTIVRQYDDKHRKAITAVASGDIATSFKIHEKNIVEISDIKEMASHAVKTFFKLDVSEQAKTLIISSTRKMRDQINDGIRKELQAKGNLKGNVEIFTTLKPKEMTSTALGIAHMFEVGNVIKFNKKYNNGITNDYYKVIGINQENNSLTLEKAGKQFTHQLKQKVYNPNNKNDFEVFEENKISFQSGLKIKFTKNDSKLGLINSETAIISTVSKDKIVLKFEDGSLKSIARDKLKHTDYGYCTTVYASQSKTFEHVIAVISNNQLLNNMKSWLVTISRHRSSLTVIAQDKNKLQEHLTNNDGNKLSALEFMSQNQKNENIQVNDKIKSNKMSYEM